MSLGNGGGWEDLFDGDGDEDGGEGGDERAVHIVNQKKGIVFVVDCSRSMFNGPQGATGGHSSEESSDDEDARFFDEKPKDSSEKDRLAMSPFKKAMAVIYIAIKHRVISGATSNNFVGVVFYATKETDNKKRFQNIVEYVPFGSITVQKLNKIKELLDEDVTDDDLANRFASPEALDDCPLTKALWYCSTAFDDAKLDSASTQELWLFTNNDVPHNTQALGETERKSKLEKLKVRIDQLCESNKYIKVWPLSSESDFDPNKFFNQALETQLKKEGDVDTSGYFVWAYEKAKEQLTKFIRKQTYFKRELAQVSLEMGQGVNIGFGVFPRFMKKAIPTSVKVDSSLEPRPLQNVTTYICSDTGDRLTDDKIIRFFTFGSDLRCFINSQEKKQITSLGSSVSGHQFSLLGFKSTSLLKPWYCQKPSYLFIPSEKKVAGSTKACQALITAMCEKQCVMLVTGVFRAGDQIKLLALFPQDEELENGVVAKPLGFNALVLPWANSIRPLKLGGDEIPTRITDEHVLAAKDVIANMRHEEKLRFIENPALQKHYAYLEAVAMGEEDPEWSDNEDDMTKPSKSQFELPRLQNALATFTAIFGKPETEEELKSIEAELKKRKSAKQRPAKTAPARKRKSTSLSTSGEKSKKRNKKTAS